MRENHFIIIEEEFEYTVLQYTHGLTYGPIKMSTTIYYIAVVADIEETIT